MILQGHKGIEPGPLLLCHESRTSQLSHMMCWMKDEPNPTNKLRTISTPNLHEADLQESGP